MSWYDEVKEGHIMSWNDMQDYCMRWVSVELKSGNYLLGKLIDVSEDEDDPVLLIDGGYSYEVPLSDVKGIEYTD